MKRLLIAFLLLSSVAWAGGPDIGFPSAEDINTAISSLTSALSGKPSLSSNNSFSGFNKLGASALGLKNLVLTGTTGSSEGAQVNIAHGIIGSKIVFCTLTVEYSAGAYVNAACNVAGFNVNLLWNATNVTVSNHPTESENVLSKPVRITVWYEE